MKEKNTEDATMNLAKQSWISFPSFRWLGSQKTKYAGRKQTGLEIMYRFYIIRFLWSSLLWRGRRKLPATDHKWHLERGQLNPIFFPSLPYPVRLTQLLRRSLLYVYIYLYPTRTWANHGWNKGRLVDTLRGSMSEIDLLHHPLREVKKLSSE